MTTDNNEEETYRNCGIDGEGRAAGFFSISSSSRGELFGERLRFSIVIVVVARNGDCLLMTSFV